MPALRQVGPGHLVACHLSADEQRRIWAERDKVGVMTGVGRASRAQA